MLMIIFGRYKAMVVYSIIFAVSLYSDTYIYFESIFASIIAFAALVCFVTALIIPKRRRVYLVRGVMLITITVILIAIGFMVNNFVESRAAEIITALEKYKSDVGSYPEKIDSLAPHYISSDILPRNRKIYSVSRYIYFPKADQSLNPIFGYQRYPFYWINYDLISKVSETKMVD